MKLYFILAFLQYNTKLKPLKGTHMSYIPLIARVDSLPPLPESVLKIESLFSEDDPDINEVVKIIESDPSLMADILSKVNAPYYGFSKTIVSILQAVTLFGSTQIRALVLASSIQRNFDIDLSPYDITTSEFSQISVMQSELIFQWYMSIDVDIARTITPIAFLMEIGKVLIAKEITQEKKEKEFQSDLLKYEDISYVENIHTMMSTAQINALIFKHLNLHDIFSECMQYLDYEQEVPANIKDMIIALHIVRTAINIQCQLTDQSIANALELVEEASLNSDSFLRAVKRIKAKYLQE